jgi:hypothetical protein
MIPKKYIPWDKSWTIRMGVLDLLNGYDDTEKFLKKNWNTLSDDLKSLYYAGLDWVTNQPVRVGESGTLYRFLKYASWKLGLEKNFILEGTLKNRQITNNPDIVNYSLEKLLELDKGTSQWASIAVIMGNTEKIENPPYKLRVTYQALLHWNKRREQGLTWKPRYDETILNQAKAFIEILKTGKTNWKPLQAEDYCFAKAFNIKVENYSSLEGHESNRVKEMEIMMNKKIIDSKDHRVVQAISMKRKTKGEEITVKYPEVVNKSWPQFWKFIKQY